MFYIFITLIIGMATCDGLTEPYLPAVLTICDLIEAGDVL